MLAFHNAAFSAGAPASKPCHCCVSLASSCSPLILVRLRSQRSQLLPLHVSHRKSSRLEVMSPVQPISMSSSTGELRRRMASIQTAEKLIDAMRRVAAARIRASAHSALAARPYAERLQAQLGALVRLLIDQRTDIGKIAADARHDVMSVLSGHVTVDISAQRALMDRMNLALLDPAQDITGGADRVRFSSPFSSATSSIHATPTAASSASYSLYDTPPPAVPAPRNTSATITLLTVFTSDRGFCGAYNKDVLARAVRRVHDIQYSHVSRSVELILVGKTAIQFFARHYPDLHVRFSTEAGAPTTVVPLTARVCDAVLSEFVAGDVERVEVVYTRFASLISNQPSVRTLLPVTPSGLEVCDDEIYQLTTRNGQLYVTPVPHDAEGTHSEASPTDAEYSNSSYSEWDTSPAAAVATARERIMKTLHKHPDYAVNEQEAVRLLNAMLPMYVHNQLSRMARESCASELACRMRAMEAASDNCRDLSKSLSARYNRERQGRITNEVIMVAGFPR